MYDIYKQKKREFLNKTVRQEENLLIFVGAKVKKLKFERMLSYVVQL